MNENIETIKEKVTSFDYKPIRKQWVRALRLVIISEALPLTILFFTFKDAFVATLIVLTGIAFQSFIQLFPPYLFGYRMEGTKWLLLVLIGLPIGFLRSFSLSGDLAPLFLILTPAYVYYWLKTKKLRKQNLLKKLLKRLECQEITQEQFSHQASKILSRI